MLIIRLQRVGKRNEPSYRLVLTDSKNGPKSGRFLKILGSYDPRDKNETILKAEAIKEAITQGAQTSDTVHNILINNKIIEGKKINALPKKTPIVKEVEEGEAPVEESAPVEETPVEEVAKEEIIEEAPKEDEKPAEESKEEEKKGE